MEIRDAELADAQAIADVENLAYRDLDPELRIEGHLLQTGERLSTAMVRNNERGVVVQNQEGLTAVAMWRPCGDPVTTSHLHLLFIHPDYQRKGLGIRLLRIHWERSLATWPTLKLFTLNTMRESYWALSFYAKHGYSAHQPGDEDRVPGLREYFAMPSYSGRPARPAYHVLQYLPAASALRCLHQQP